MYRSAVKHLRGDTQVRFISLPSQEVPPPPPGRAQGRARIVRWISPSAVERHLLQRPVHSVAACPQCFEGAASVICRRMRWRNAPTHGILHCSCQIVPEMENGM